MGAARRIPPRADATHNAVFAPGGIETSNATPNPVMSAFMPSSLRRLRNGSLLSMPPQDRTSCHSNLDDRRALETN
jgi:hypothetical protein